MDHRPAVAVGPPVDVELIGDEPAGGVQLLEAAQDRWRAVNGPHLVALVRAGARFGRGVLVERPDEDEDAAAGVAA